MHLEQFLPAILLFLSLLLGADSLYQIDLGILFVLTSDALENEAGHRDFFSLFCDLIVSLDLVYLSPLSFKHVIQKVSTSNIGNLIDDCPEPEF